jgi:N-acetylmuramoyl-L-alanine amidase
VLDVQRRLRALGFCAVDEDEPGTFARGTERALRAFQEQRNLRVDGCCGSHTWAVLVEAGFGLGERLLYLRTPFSRGDDVAELQRQLGALGFDAGRVDGIFGPNTQRALMEFQRNAGLAEDGICGPATVQVLRRVSTRTNLDSVVTGIRERIALLSHPPTLAGWRVAVGESGGLDALVEGLRRSLRKEAASVLTLHHPDESTQAAHVNASKAHVYLGVSLNPALDGCVTSYFLGPHGFFSAAGRHLAEGLASQVSAHLGIPALGSRGLNSPVLRETRMPAVLLELGPGSVVVERAPAVVEAVTASLATWVATPYPDAVRP